MFIDVGRLDGISLVLPDPQLFLYTYVRQEAVLSSQIDGTQSSLSDLLRHELDDAPAALLGDVTEVSCYVDAMQHGLAQLQAGEPLSLRLLITFLLCAEGVLAQPLLYLSLHFKRHRSDYYRLLQEVRETGIWEDWLRFFFEGVIQTSESATRTAKSLLTLFEKDRAQLAGESASVLRLHQLLQQHPVTTAVSAARALGIAHPTASRSLRTLNKLGIVQELEDSTYRRFFAYSGYLEILNRD